MIVFLKPTLIIRRNILQLNSCAFGHLTTLLVFAMVRINNNRNKRIKREDRAHHPKRERRVGKKELQQRNIGRERDLKETAQERFDEEANAVGHVDRAERVAGDDVPDASQSRDREPEYIPRRVQEGNVPGRKLARHHAGYDIVTHKAFIKPRREEWSDYKQRVRDFMSSSRFSEPVRRRENELKYDSPKELLVDYLQRGCGLIVSSGMMRAGAHQRQRTQRTLNTQKILLPGTAQIFWDGGPADRPVCVVFQYRYQLVAWKDLTEERIGAFFVPERKHHQTAMEAFYAAQAQANQQPVEVVAQAFDNFEEDATHTDGDEYDAAVNRAYARMFDDDGRDAGQTIPGPEPLGPPWVGDHAFAKWVDGFGFNGPRSEAYMSTMWDAYNRMYSMPPVEEKDIPTSTSALGDLQALLATLSVDLLARLKQVELREMMESSFYGAMRAIVDNPRILCVLFLELVRLSCVKRESLPTYLVAFLSQKLVGCDSAVLAHLGMGLCLSLPAVVLISKAIRHQSEKSGDPEVMAQAWTDYIGRSLPPGTVGASLLTLLASGLIAAFQLRGYSIGALDVADIITSSTGVRICKTNEDILTTFLREGPKVVKRVVEAVKRKDFGMLFSDETQVMHARLMAAHSYYLAGALPETAHECFASQQDFLTKLDDAISDMEAKVRYGRASMGEVHLLRELINMRLAQASMRGGKLKRQPFAVAVTGKSAQAKSTIVYYLQHALYSELGNGPLESDMIAFISEADAYDTTVTNKTTCGVLDDLGNLKKDYDGKGTAYRVLAWINNVEIPATKAAVHEKGTVFPPWRLIIATSNVADLGVAGWSNEPVSLARRFQYYLRVSLKPEFATLGMADPEKLRDANDRLPLDTVPDWWDVTIERAHYAADGHGILFRSVVTDEGRNLVNVSFREALQYLMLRARDHKITQDRAYEAAYRTPNMDTMRDSVFEHEAHQPPAGVQEEGGDDIIRQSFADFQQNVRVHVGVPALRLAARASTSVYSSLSQAHTWAIEQIAAFGASYHSMTNLSIFARCVMALAVHLDWLGTRGRVHLISEITTIASLCFIVGTYFSTVGVLVGCSLIFLNLAFRSVLYVAEGGPQRTRAAQIASLVEPRFVVGCVALLAVYLLAKRPQTVFRQGVVEFMSSDEKKKTQAIHVSRDSTESSHTTAVDNLARNPNIRSICKIRAGNEQCRLVLTFMETGKAVGVAHTLTPPVRSELDRTKRAELEYVVGGMTYSTAIQKSNIHVDDTCDLLFVQFPSCKLRDLTQYLASEAFVGQLEYRTHRANGFVVTNQGLASVGPTVHGTPISLSGVRVHRQVLSPLMSSHITSSGDCGSPLVVSLAQMGNGVATILGVHTGITTDKKHTSSSLLSREKYLEGFAVIAEHQRQDAMTEPPSVLGQSGKVIVDVRPQHCLAEILSTRRDLRVIGEYIKPSAGCTSVTTRSKLRKLQLLESESATLDKLIGPLEHKLPLTRLDSGAVVMLGGNVSYHKPILKITNNPHHNLAVQLDAAKRDYLEPILAELTEGSFHPLDLMQAVNGSFDGQFPGLEMSTSPGGEYGCKKGDLMDDVVFGPTPKQPLPNTHYMDMANPYPNGQRVFWPKRELLEKMEVYKEAIRKGSMSAISYNSALKDEAVALDKTRARVFFIGDVAVTILIRMYYGPVVLALRKLMVLSECAVGLDVTGPQWEEVMSVLNAKDGSERLAGDFEGYDMSLHVDLTRTAYATLAAMAVHMYGSHATEQDIQLIHNLTRCMAYPVISLLGVLIHVAGINTSGSPITTQVNSICNSLLYRVAFFMRNPKLVDAVRDRFSPFRSCVALLTYGDDSVAASRRGGRENRLNNFDVRAAASAFAMVYGPAEKKGELPEYYAAEAVPFLKCEDATVELVDGKRVRVGIIALSSVRKSCTFYRHGTQELCDNFRSAQDLFFPRALRDKDPDRFEELRQTLAHIYVRVAQPADPVETLGWILDRFPTYEQRLETFSAKFCEAEDLIEDEDN